MREGAKSFSGAQSTKHWTDKTIWFDAAPYASVGIEKAKKVLHEHTSAADGWDGKIEE